VLVVLMAGGELVLEVGVAEGGEPGGQVRVEELGEFLEGVEELVGVLVFVLSPKILGGLGCVMGTCG